MIIVGNGLAPFRLFVADDYCRERACAVPFGHVEEGVKPLPYENNQAKVDILAPFRLFVADDCCRERPCVVLSGWVAKGVKPLPYDGIESSRERWLTAPSHTTGHAGPHPAVQ